MMPYDVSMMTHGPHSNRVRQLRSHLGWTQAQLADRAGISRTAVTAIEAERLSPSVETALSLAAALGTSVEELFGEADASSPAEIWAATPTMESGPCWQAEVGGKTVLYPAGSLPMLTPLPDRTARKAAASVASAANETLVMACCDPAAGLLASLFTATTGFRLLVIPHSSRQAVEMLRDGLVHLAGVHLSTSDEPNRNSEAARNALGGKFRMLRLARWQEGIAITPTAKVRSIRSAVNGKLNWIGRETGSGARQCLDRLFNGRPVPKRMARNHRGVAEAIQSGWADAGVCVHLVSAEAGLDFLPVQQENYDVCFPEALAGDRRIKAFLNVVRSAAYRKLLSGLPGYETAETGELWEGN